MAARGRNKVKAVKVTAYIDGPTPERMRRDVWGMVAPAQGGAGSSVQKIHAVVARGSVDHLYGLGALTFWQWEAARQYRELMETGWPMPRVVGGYEGRSSPSNDPSPVPMTDRAEKARAKLARLRLVLSLPHRRMIEEAIVNEREPERGRARKGYLDELRFALTAAAKEMGLSA